MSQYWHCPDCDARIHDSQLNGCIKCNPEEAIEEALLVPLGAPLVLHIAASEALPPPPGGRRR